MRQNNSKGGGCMLRIDRIHNVGSYPAETAEIAIDDQLFYGGQRLRTVSDGEVAAPDWLADDLDRYRDDDHPDFVVAQEGDWSDYDHCPVFDVAPGRTLTPESFDFAYYDRAAQSWPIFQDIRSTVNRPDLRLQVGMPSPDDIALFTFGEEKGFDPGRVAAAREGTLQQIRKIRESEFGEDVVIQLETPLTLALAHMIDAPEYHEKLARDLTSVARDSPADTRFGIHLCVGDLGNKYRQEVGEAQRTSRRIAVTLGNLIADMWPEGRSLDYIHEPIAMGQTPPPLEASAYEELRQLRLRAGTDYVAGIVHEAAPMEDQQTVLGLISWALPTEREFGFGIAAGCGLGRREQEVAGFIMMRAAQLAAHTY